MMHRRLRTFNTKDTYPEQNLDNDLSQAVIAGKTIYLRGQVPQDLDTRENVAVGDAAGQAEKVMANIALLLEECGAPLASICKVTVYRVAGRWLTGVFPVFTGLVVVALARPEWLVEIDVIAQLE
jgi:enamine deaminase RidA (YjgF/YER057c/UK114 family)